MRLSMGRRSRKNPTIDLATSHQAGSCQIIISKLGDILGRRIDLLTSSDHAVGQQLAQAGPNPRINLDIERTANEQHQKSCLDLSHGEQPP